MAKKRKVYWTPKRIAELMRASGATTQDDFAEICRCSKQLISAWLRGTHVPEPMKELALDCLAARFGIPHSES